MDTNTLLFFDRHPKALPIYENFEKRLYQLFPETQKKVQKTQITFSNKHVFACVSFLRVRKKAELPDPYIVITLCLPYPLDSERVAASVEPYPGRWTTHIVIGDDAAVDDELFSWVQQAYHFSAVK